MSVTVRVPTVLKRSTGDSAEIQVAAGTVGEILAELSRRFPDFGGKVLEGGRVRPYLNVYVNGDDIRFAKELDTPAHDGDEVAIVPSVAGGR
jgi:MoaD family protein